MAYKYPRPEYDPTTHEFCTKCFQVKPHSAFPKGSKEGCRYRSGLHAWCLTCNNAAALQWAEASPANKRSRRDDAVISARRRSVREGRRTEEYWQERPILAEKPAAYAQRLRLLGLTPDLDRRRV